MREEGRVGEDLYIGLRAVREVLVYTWIWLLLAPGCTSTHGLSVHPLPYPLRCRVTHREAQFLKRSWVGVHMALWSSIGVSFDRQFNTRTLCS